MKRHLGPIALLFSVALSACQKSETAVTKPQTEAKTTQQTKKRGVIYGDDNRIELYQVQNPQVKDLAYSTVALFEASTIDMTDGNTARIKGRNYGSSYRLCAEEPYREQDTAAFCSGFLVNSQTIVTAGHCVNQTSCGNVRFGFGYALESNGKLPLTLPAKNIYSCTKVVHSQQLVNADYGPDFAVVTLDRPVTDFKPLNLRQQGTIQVGEPVMVIGHPAGLPMKIAGGANVRDNSPAAYFVANLDTYGGNSGSAVFNERTGLVEGILVRGEIDFVTKPNEKCTVSNVCKSDGCMGEHVTKIENVLPYLQ